MSIDITDSARRHGIRDDQIRYVIEHGGPVFDQPAPGVPGDSRLVYLGDDEHGIPLEVVAVESESGDLRVIHALDLRRNTNGSTRRPSHGES